MAAASRRLLFGVLAIGLLPLLSAAAPASFRLATTPAASSGWLDRLNQWRASTGTSTLSEDATFSAGDVLHATYMVKTGDVRHGELPSYTSYYTPAGDTAGQNSNIFVSSSTGTTDVRSIDWWMAAPFHAMSMVDPRLTTTGFGSYRDPAASPWQMGAALNVGQGMSAPGQYPVFFPGNGSTEPLTNFSGNEFPDPTAACPGYSGLPLFIEVGANLATTAGPVHTLTGNGTQLTHCVIDSTDSRYTGYLRWRGAVIVFPQAPLQTGVTYVVALTVNSQPYTWTFKVGPIGTLCGGSPNVTSIAPASGPGAGGTSVTINGCGFTGATVVKFGTSTGIGLTVVSDTQVTALSPAHAAGPVDVTVTTAKGTSPTGSADVFTYSAPPGPPVNPTAAQGNLSATVAWSPPASDGGSAVTSYTATSSPGGLTSTVGGSATSAVVPGLTLGTTYSFTVVATNVNGSSAASAPSNSITAITVPSAPTTVTANAANASAILTWTAPPNGGGVITGYVVTPYVGGVAGAPVTFSQTNLMEVLTGLTNGVTYTFTVRAVNAAGSGAVSGQTGGVMPSPALRQPSAQGATSTPAPRTAPVQSSSAPPPPPR